MTADEFARAFDAAAMAADLGGAGSSSNGVPSGYYLLTPVWGESYTRLYVDVVIPSQLASGNLVVFKNEPNCRYIIYTRPQDAEIIRSSAIFEQLNACVPVTFEWIRNDVHVVHDLMTDCFRRGIAVAERANAAILLMTPDIVFSSGSFATLKRLSQEGHDVIFIPAIRTIKNAVVETLIRSFRSGELVEIAPRHLVQVALDNLHPLGHSSWWEEGDGGLIPANIYWRVANEGLVAHCFHLHPILVNPQQKNVRFFGTVDDDYILAACPDFSRDCIVADSDDVFVVELSDPSRYFEMRFEKGSVKDTVRWAEQFTNRRHQKLFTKAIRLHTGMVNTQAWQAAEARARPVVAEIAARLDWPFSKLLFDADLIPRRLVRWTKEFRLQIANAHLGGSAERNAAGWQNAVLSLFQAVTELRARVVDALRWIATQIETLAAKPYQAVLDRQLTGIIGRSSDVVFASNSPGKRHLENWLVRHSDKFAKDRYLSLLGEGSISLLERGQRIAERSKSCAVLELDAFRSKGIPEYLQEVQRVLQDQGSLIVYLHRLAPHDNEPPLTETQLLRLLPPGFRIEKTWHQGGVGTLLWVKLQNWVRGLINRRLDLRGLLLILGLPLLPVVLSLGTLVIALTAILDLVDRSGRFCASNLILAIKQSSPQN